MKATTILAAAVAALSGTAYGKEYTPVYLPAPENWVPSHFVWPTRILAGFNDAYSPYSQVTFTEMLKVRCDADSECSAIVQYSSIPANPPGVRRWFGYLLAGPPVEPQDFMRETDPAHVVQDSKAFHAVPSPIGAPQQNATVPH
ncbi:hypothetical protein GX51_00432 [Blastomyces parvus]|uniref:Uncharacterized protein n=1 Tax=Blastomyces parvus TaxID=2060905 RepID=A0A2B7XM87_9EURO|nr:hypothetical protein GX51_00432 [Blastomyces parvus]